MMFCPGCSAYLSEKELVKTSVKYAPGNVPIEYEARCPQCRVEMGTVSWGQLTVNPNLATKVNEPEAKAPAPLITAPELRSTLGKPAPKTPKKCPHCGEELPAGF